MTNTTPTTLRGWIQQAQAEGYIWPDIEVPLTYDSLCLECPCKSLQQAKELMKVFCEYNLDFTDWKFFSLFMWERTDIFFVFTKYGGTEKVLITPHGAYNPITMEPFDTTGIRFFHEINAPAGPDA